MVELQDKELMLVRGQYATINGEHKDQMKRLQQLTGSLSSVASQVLKGVQPADDATPIDVSTQLMIGRGLLDDIDRCVMRLAELAKQRNELKPLAWPRNK